MTALTPRIVACLAATWVIWGSTYFAIKLALTGFPPFLQNGTRFLLAGSILSAWVCWRRQRMPTLVQWRNAAVVGTLMLAANVGGVAFAEQWLASGLVTAFIAIVPALITIASLPFGVRPSRLEVLGIVLGFVGVLMLVRGATFTASPVGVLAIVTAALGWSTGSVLSQHVLRLAPAAAGFASAMLCAGGVLIALSIITGERLHWPPAVGGCMGVDLSVDLRLAHRLLGLHDAAAEHATRARDEQQLRQSRDRDDSRRSDRRRGSYAT